MMQLLSFILFVYKVFKCINIIFSIYRAFASKVLRLMTKYVDDTVGQNSALIVTARC